MNVTLRSMICPVALLLVSSALAAAQPLGSIEGFIVDANDGALPGVVVTVAGSEGPREGVTGADGGFSFTGLSPAATMWSGRL